MQAEKREAIEAIAKYITRATGQNLSAGASVVLEAA
jgi:hypothetical protein